MLFASGQVGLDPDSRTMVAGGVAAETRQALANLTAVLEAGGASRDTVLKTTVFLADMADFSVMNEIYSAWFGADPPARSTVAVLGLPLGARVEIEAVAHAAGAAES
jgi:2-iminobutanoate/2-iminopropanoate deaminase